MKQSAWIGYSKRTYKKNRKPINYNQHDRFYLRDNRNRCQQDEVFGKPRQEQCDCMGCVAARKLQREIARGVNLCQILKIPVRYHQREVAGIVVQDSIADFINVLLTDDDIYEIVALKDEENYQENTAKEDE